MRKLLILAAAALCACGGNAQKKAAEVGENAVVIDMHNAENSLNYVGTYKGTLPAADCPGIETTLTLRADGSYELVQKFIERDASFTEMGKYTLSGDLLTLMPDNNPQSFYKIEEGRLRMLGSDKQEVTGELAPHYILTKNN